MRAQMSNAETADLGLNFPAGGDHYRAYVGPPGVYDLVGAIQFEAMLALGLREYHSLLEVGCGSLRAGRLFLPYLLPDRYYAVEPNFKFLNDGMEAHFGGSIYKKGLFRSRQSSIMKTKRPRFYQNNKFDFRHFGQSFDYVLAQSILSHTGNAETELFMREISRVINDQSVVFFTFIKGDNDTKEDGWFYPKCVTYTADFMKSLASKYSMTFEITDWPPLNNTASGKISGQTPALLRLSP